ncbi:MAG: hypothetical protein U9Q12_01940 [Patescibacteria group bacterium]|nr:hypothetical protein [Patescibacteria group bacterium]
MYEGKYYKFKIKDIDEVLIGQHKAREEKQFTKFVAFDVPRVWLNEYKDGVYIDLKDFPKYWRTKIQKELDDLDGKNGVFIISGKLEKELKKYFVKKITITDRQAKELMKIQFADISPKEAHKVHKRIGLK